MLQAIKDRHAAATPGPYESMPGLPGWIQTVTPPYPCCAGEKFHFADIRGFGDLTAAGRLRYEDAEKILDANAEFVRESWSDIAYLLDLIKNMRRIIDDNQFAEADGAYIYCTSCGAASHKGHKQGCEIADVLTRSATVS